MIKDNEPSESKCPECGKDSTEEDLFHLGHCGECEFKLWMSGDDV